MLANLPIRRQYRSAIRRQWHVLLCVFLGLWVGGSEAAEDEFWIKPDKCISNFKGQDCNKRINLFWDLNQKAEYCLFRSSSKAPIVCWKNMSLRRYTLRFKSSRDETFSIRRSDNDELVAEFEFTVAWVYRSGKNSFFGWRVF